MYSSPLCYPKPGPRSAASSVSRHFNMGALALALLVALALSTVGGSSSRNKDAAPANKTSREDFVAWQFVTRTMKACKDAFDDPSVIAYANEQGKYLPDSLTTSPRNSSDQPPALSKPASGRAGKLNHR